MTDPTEREAIVSIMWEAAGNYSFPHGAERIIAEHIVPLRKALAHAQMEGDIRAEERDAWMQAARPNKAVEAQFIVWRDRAEAAESRASALEAERDKLHEEIEEFRGELKEFYDEVQEQTAKRGLTMSERTEREAIARIIWDETPQAFTIVESRRVADHIAEHIEPLRAERNESVQVWAKHADEMEARASALETVRDKLEAAFQDAMASCNRWRDDAHAAESRSSALKAERDKVLSENAQLVTDYGERGDLLAECRVRVSELEVERDEARELAQHSTRRLAELSEPGWIGAFAARDIAQSRASALEALLAEVGEALKPLTAQELTSEMSREDEATADFEGAYDTIVEIARSVLAKLKARTS